MWFRIPLDHNNPNSPTFPLRAYHSNKGFNKPVVLIIEGYTMYTRASELTKILDANQLTIEHRFSAAVDHRILFLGATLTFVKLPLINIKLLKRLNLSTKGNGYLLESAKADKPLFSIAIFTLMMLM